jgi:diguanylate cyclase (GGDEF)-like protein
VRDYEVRLRNVNGREFWLLMSAQPIRYAGVVGLLVALADIDLRKRMQEDMKRKAMHDQLTGLPNRAMFMESLERAVRKAKRRQGRFSVLFIDLDHFKQVNDTMGHAAGDRLLQAMAERLASAVRQSDLVARLAGDEFVVLIEDHKGPEEVMIVAQKVVGFLQRPVLLEWREVSISGSVGIASYPEDGEEVDSLVKDATTSRSTPPR